MASMFAGKLYKRWRACVSRRNEGKLDAISCEKEYQIAMAKVLEVQNEQLERLKYLNMANEMEEMARCGFYYEMENRKSSKAENVDIDCYARALCKSELMEYMSCVNKKDGNYDDESCLQKGQMLSRCLGEKLTNCKVKHTHWLVDLKYKTTDEEQKNFVKAKFG